MIKMREFTDMTIVPATNFVSVNGEGYHCDPLMVRDVQGATRTIPGDKILAIHWHGKHGHGHVEWGGPAEGFDDRIQIEMYLRPWLIARAKAKQSRASDLVRKRAIELAEIASHEGVKVIVERAASDIGTELRAASANGRANVQARLDIAVEQVRLVAERIGNIRARLTLPDDIAAAQAEADLATKEAS